MEEYGREALQKVVARYKNIDNAARFRRSRERGYDDAAEMRLLACVILNPDWEMSDYATVIGKSTEYCRGRLHYFGLQYPGERDMVLRSCREYLSRLYERLANPRDERAKRRLYGFARHLGEHIRYRTRCFYFLTLVLFARLEVYKDIFPRREEWVTGLSRRNADDFFRDLVYELDRVAKPVDVAELSEVIEKSLSESHEEETEETHRGAEQSIRELESKLSVTESALEFIRRSLDDMVAHTGEQAEAAREEAINNFFTSLNSERYGCLLDSTLTVFARLQELRRARFRMPPELMGVNILVKNFYAFVKESGFEPIRELGEVFLASAEELAYASYTGTPFIGEEKKRVEVVRPGWKKGEVIISRPVVREAEEEAIDGE